MMSCGAGRGSSIACTAVRDRMRVVIRVFRRAASCLGIFGTLPVSSRMRRLLRMWCGESVEILERAISADCERSFGSQQRRASEPETRLLRICLKQEYSVQTERMAATIMINALMFHMNLARSILRLKGFEDLRPDGKLLATVGCSRVARDSQDQLLVDFQHCYRDC